MGMGYLIGKHRWACSVKSASICLVVFTLLRTLEYFLPVLYPSDFWQNNSLSLAFIFQALAYFMLAESLNLQLSKEESLWLRQLSSCIYFTHAIVLYEFLNPLLLRYTDLPVFTGWMILPKVIITLLVCLIFFLVVKRLNNKSLNVLING